MHALEANAEKILFLLKTRGPQTAAALAEQLAMTSAGARQHLAQLQTQQLVEPEDRRESVGRPKRYWQLTAAAQRRFPDSHAHLTLELLDAVRSVFGDGGMEKLIAKREASTLAHYLEHTQTATKLAQRVAKLAELRDQEGYMASWEKSADGAFILIENHCPICAAAQRCQNLCRSELAIFRAVFADMASIERTDHLLAGARRCAYRIAPHAAR